MIDKEVAFVDVFYFLSCTNLKLYQIKILLHKFISNLPLQDISIDCRDCDSEERRCECIRHKSQQRIDESIRTSLRKLRRVNVSKIFRSVSNRASGIGHKE